MRNTLFKGLLQGCLALAVFILGLWLIFGWPVDEYRPSSKEKAPPRVRQTDPREQDGIKISNKEMNSGTSRPQAAMPEDKHRRAEQVEAEPEAKEKEDPQEDPKTNQRALSENSTPTTARAWFEKGLGLNNDSKEEIACYVKALKKDSTFAPAHYRLGAIYMREAQFKKAERHFALFWKHASKAEKEKYNLYIYTSPEEIEDQLKAKDKKDRRPSAVPYTKQQGHMLVEAVLEESTRAKMLIDTGASISLISREMAERLGIAKQGTVRLNTIAKQAITASWGYLSCLELGSVIEERDLRVAIVPLSKIEGRGFDGIIGMDVLGKHQLFIDHKNQEIVTACTTP
ncbi:hypothetical protein AKJ60_00770 [candidate division MSBL1 archaeon SCGC-AAA385M11]|nr:hypothetical protein AKJ60_00770 [candidate division MSBL1 archaeon SCGC-AAA385M11]